jgi:Flp pilus assembly pilin Flp
MTDFINRIFASLLFAAGEARGREEGQTLVEYALILTMVSIGSIAVLLALSGKINGIFTDISNAL